MFSSRGVFVAPLAGPRAAENVICTEYLCQEMPQTGGHIYRQNVFVSICHLLYFLQIFLIEVETFESMFSIVIINYNKK